MEALDEESLSLKPQTLRLLLPVLWPVQVSPIVFRKRFLDPGDPRKWKLGGLVGSGKTSMAFDFGPNTTVRPNVFSTGKNTPETGNRQFAENNERG